MTLEQPTKSDKNPETIKDDILFDICMYEKELSATNLRVEEIIALQVKIKNAEDLFKTIK